MILSVYRYVANSAWLILLSVIAQVISYHFYMGEIRSAPQSQACRDEFAYASCLPDLMMGLPFDLNHLYDIWTPELHAAYVGASIFDFVIGMPGFTLMLGSLLCIAARRLGISETVAHLATLVLVSDVNETYLSRYGSIIYPKRLPDLAVRFASLAGQCKWITSYVAVIIIVAGFLQSRNNKTEKTS